MALTQFYFNQDFKGVDKRALWDFIKNPKNLARITPRKMIFQVLTDPLPEEMYAGMMIAYKVSPLLGIKMNWVTEITHVTDGVYFVDEQRSGPYKIWHHEHRLVELPDGTIRMEDILSYQPPFGVLGSLMNRLVIKQQIHQIFAFREQAMIEIFEQKKVRL